MVTSGRKRRWVPALFPRCRTLHADYIQNRLRNCVETYRNPPFLPPYPQLPTTTRTRGENRLNDNESRSHWTGKLEDKRNIGVLVVQNNNRRLGLQLLAELLAVVDHLPVLGSRGGSRIEHTLRVPLPFELLQPGVVASPVGVLPIGFGKVTLVNIGRAVGTGSPERPVDLVRQELLGSLLFLEAEAERERIQGTLVLHYVFL